MRKQRLPLLKGSILVMATLLLTFHARSQCTAPSGLGFTAVSATTANISWTSGGASNWNIEYGPIGFTQGTGTMLNATSTTVTLTGLTPNLIYEFYVRDSCGVGNVSSWAGPQSFNAVTVHCDNFDGYSTGLVAPQSTLINEWAGGGGDAQLSSAYASSPPYSMNISDTGSSGYSDVIADLGVYSSGIHNVQFDFYIPSGYGGYYNILHNYVGVGTNVWAIEVYLGSNGTAEVQEGSNGTGIIGNFSFNVGAWNTVEHIIDLDNDTAFILVNGAFTDVGWEFSLGSTNYGGQFNAVDFYSAAPVGDTPVMFFDNFCITPAPVDDIGMMQFIGSSPMCGDSNYVVEAVVRNHAMNNQSGFDMHVDITGTSSASYTTTYPGVLKPGQSDTVALGPLNTLAGGTYNFTAYSDLTGDNDIFNDTIVQNNIVFLPGVSVQFGPEDTVYCDNESFSLLLNAQNSGATYAWNDGSTASSKLVDTVGFYAVTVTGSNGCTATDAIEVTELPAMEINLGSDVHFCADQTIFYFLNGGSTGTFYDWSTGDTTQIIEVTAAGTYTVAVGNPNGCISRDTVEFVELPLPVVQLPDDEVCGGDTVFLDAGNPGSTYSWNIPGESDQVLEATETGTYAVTVTDTNGCTGSDSATVTVHPEPLVILGPDTTIVQGQSLTLDAGNPGASYEWSTGATTQTISVNQAGTYTVTVTDQFGCQETDEITVDVKVGIAGLHPGSLRLYPNPVTHTALLDLDLEAAGQLHVTVFSASGQKAMEVHQTARTGRQTLSLDMSTLSDGLYFLQVSVDDQSIATLPVSKH